MNTHQSPSQLNIALIVLPTMMCLCTESHAETRLLSHGADRVLIDESATLSFTPVVRRQDGVVVYTALDSELHLHGAHGRYVLTGGTGSRHFIGGQEISNTLAASALPPTIELKRPPVENPGMGILNSLLVAEYGDESDCPTQCDIESNPPSESFSRGPFMDGALALDIRPTSCTSFFSEYASIDRGTQIENALAYHEHYADTLATVRSFPVVDFIGAGEARVIHSRDLASPSYSNPGDVYNRLMADGREIETVVIDTLNAEGFIEHTEQGQTTRLEGTPPPDFVLEVVVQHGVASPAQIAEMQQAAEDLARDTGIVLRVIEIP